eukprot:SAG25_NODE_13477_length_266_cov_0.958084_1_plen_54_part_01
MFPSSVERRGRSTGLRFMRESGERAERRELVGTALLEGDDTRRSPPGGVAEAAC